MCHPVGLFGYPVWDILCFLDLGVGFLHQVREVLHLFLAVCFLDLGVSFLHQVREVLHLFLAVLGLCCCMGAFSRCDEQELLSSCSVTASHCGGCSCGCVGL